VHRAPAQRADLGGAQHRHRQAPPQSIRRKSVPPADLATRPRERPPRHPPTHPRHDPRRGTPRHTLQLDEGPRMGVETSLNQSFQARRTAAGQVTPRASASSYLTYRRRVTIGAVLGVTCPGFPGVTHAMSAGGPKQPVRTVKTGVAAPPGVADPRGHGAAHGGPRRGLRHLRGQGVEGRLDRGTGRPLRGAPRPKLPTHWQLGIRRRRTQTAGGNGGGRHAHHSDGGRAGVALRGPGASRDGPGADLLRPRDPGCQRLPTGGPWANVCNGRRRQIPPGGSRNGPRSQGHSPADRQETDGPQGGAGNVAFAIKCDVSAIAPVGAST